MPVDLYVGRSIEELEKLLRIAQDASIKGGIQEVSAAGVRTVRAQTPAKLANDIFNLRYSLYLRAKGTDLAAKYPDPRTERITRTRTLFNEMV